MSKTFSKKPLALALGAAFALTGMGAQASVFHVADLGAGYMVADAKSDAKMKEGKCGEGKCGAAAFKTMDKNGDGMLSQEEFMAGHKAKEGKCGEGKCGADKKKTEGKCGEGKCGGKK